MLHVVLCRSEGAGGWLWHTICSFCSRARHQPALSPLPICPLPLLSPFLPLLLLWDRYAEFLKERNEMANKDWLSMRDQVGKGGGGGA